jgi:septum formation protein
VIVPLWLAPQPLLLASKSSARHALLAAAGVEVTVQPASIDERAIEAKAGAIGPGDAALLLARAKARAVAAGNPSRIVLGADQTLALGERRFSKAADRAAARSQLVALRGKTHTLHSAIALAQDNKLLFDHVDTARLTMRDFSFTFLESYLTVVGDAAFASVGGYQLEGAGIQLFDKIEGDHSTILGLPLMPLLHWLREHGMLAK